MPDGLGLNVAMATSAHPRPTDRRQRYLTHPPLPGSDSGSGSNNNNSSGSFSSSCPPISLSPLWCTVCQGEGEGEGEPMPQHNSRAGSSGVGVASKLEKRRRERWERRHAPPTKIGRLILQRRIYRRENGKMAEPGGMIPEIYASAARIRHTLSLSPSRPGLECSPRGKKAPEAFCFGYTRRRRSMSMLAN